MSSIWIKIQGTIAALAHLGLDTIDNEIPVDVLKVNVRKFEEARDQLNDNLAVANARITSLKNEIAGLDSKIAQKNKDIELLLTDDNPDNDADAVVLQQEQNKLEAQRNQKQSELDNDATKTVVNLKKALGEMNQQLDGMNQKLRTAAQLHRTTIAKENATKAVKAAASLAGNASVDDILESMNERAAVADAGFEQQVGGMKSSTDEAVETARALARIKERKAALAAGKKDQAAA